jgi:hypothetical protein
MIVSWEERGKDLLKQHISAGISFTPLDFKNELRWRSIQAVQSEVGEWLRDQFRNGSMKPYKAKTNGTYMTYYLPFLVKVWRFIKPF